MKTPNLRAWPSRVAIFGCAALAFSLTLIATLRNSDAQGIPFRRCVAFSEYWTICPDCNGTWTPTSGCTAPPPSTWAPGVCDPYPAGMCSEWLNYDCGVWITCGSQFPLNQPCVSGINLCR